MVKATTLRKGLFHFAMYKVKKNDEDIFQPLLPDEIHIFHHFFVWNRSALDLEYKVLISKLKPAHIDTALN